MRCASYADQVQPNEARHCSRSRARSDSPACRVALAGVCPGPRRSGSPGWARASSSRGSLRGNAAADGTCVPSPSPSNGIAPRARRAFVPTGRTTGARRSRAGCNGGQRAAAAVTIGSGQARPVTPARTGSRNSGPSGRGAHPAGTDAAALTTVRPITPARAGVRMVSSPAEPRRRSVSIGQRPRQRSSRTGGRQQAANRTILRLRQ